eukprot:jgi/Chrzof1/5205/Cz15g16090.t1
MLPWWYFWTEHKHGGVRWTMCAKDICFTNKMLSLFFLNGKTLPIERGGGVEQPVMDAAARRLAAGDCMHIFPEGRVIPQGHLGPFKQGIGKLVCDAHAAAGDRDPIILPFYHSGMGRVMPYRSMLPRIGHTVHVVVGEPVDLSHVTCRCNQPGQDQQQVWRDIAAAMRDALQDLEPKVPPNPNQMASNPKLKEFVPQIHKSPSSEPAPSASAGSSASAA